MRTRIATLLVLATASLPFACSDTPRSADTGEPAAHEPSGARARPPSPFDHGPKDEGDFIVTLRENGDIRSLEMKQGRRTAAKDFFSKYASSLKLGASDTMELQDAPGRPARARYNQYHRGVPVERAQWVLSEKDGVVTSGHGHIISGLDVNTRPTVRESDALSTALAAVGAGAAARTPDSPPISPEGTLLIGRAGVKEGVEDYKLLYRFFLQAGKPAANHQVYVDAQSGSIVRVDRVRLD